jgi:uncharacterized protein
MLTKELNEGFKDLDTSQGIVTGYFAMFGSKDLDGDIIEQGAFSKTVQERGPNGKGLIKYLLDHDRNKAVAKIEQLYEDSKGLYYEAKVGSHMVGKDFLEMVKSGIINQHSFGFSVPKDKSYFDQSRKANIIKEVMMYEGSAIQFLGANPETTSIGLKSFEDYLKSLEKFIQTSDASDDCIIKIESLLKKLKPDVTTLNEKKADQNRKLIEHLKNSLETWKTN